MVQGWNVLPATIPCEHYVKYDASKTKVQECLGCNVVVYQDGFIKCCSLDNVGCEKCYTEFMKGIE